jgi:NAD-dependent SIR2 family protein deacetylase
MSRINKTRYYIFWRTGNISLIFKLPKEFDIAFEKDQHLVDLLIVIGSSLKVAPVADVKGIFYLFLLKIEYRLISHKF